VPSWSYPPNGVTDARQPSGAVAGTALQGIEFLIVSAPAGAGDQCFTLCETMAEGADNFIRDVTECPSGVYMLQLDRPITPGLARDLA